MKDTRFEEVEELVVPLAMAPDTFRTLGYRLVDRLADFLGSLPDRPAAPDTTRPEVCEALGVGGLPNDGTAPDRLLDEAGEFLVRYSRLNGHPRAWGYIVGAPAPLGMLGDLLAAAVNPNCAGWQASPAAGEMERQAVAWLAELLGYPPGAGGLLVSGGTMANFVGFLAARRAKAGWDVRAEGMAGKAARRLRVYASEETHTWIQKAADMAGLGTDAIAWVATDGEMRLDVADLRRRIDEDRARGDRPFLVVGTAGTVSTGAIDPLPAIAALCREYDLWFHVDGAYGAPAAAVPGAPADLAGLREADSLAVDGHKWLYLPLEIGCVLVRDPQSLRETFDYRPSYYHFASGPDAGAPEDGPLHYYQYGPQNSRGLRALKLWLALKQVGRKGYLAMIDRDMRLSRRMYRVLSETAEIEAVTQSLSIATFRYLPSDLDPGDPATAGYLDDLNKALMARLQASGEVFISNAVVEGKFLLRACITNFRTQAADVDALAEVVCRHGGALHREMR
jgi:glutamate/tyrosine decarboxylase-like PLP-dependent enzyme